MRSTGVRDRRVLSVVVVVTLLVATIGVTGGFSALDGHDAGGDDDQPRTTWHVRVQQDGDARVTITMRFSLATENETRAFDRLAREFENGETTTLSMAPFERAASLASNATRRVMTISAVERSTRIRGDTGELVLSFRWTNFAQTPGDLLVVGGVFRTPTGTWLPGLEADQELIIEFPPQYQPESLDWPIQDGAVYIRGPVEFAPGEPSVTFAESVPELSIRDASLSADRIRPGESVTVRATVENSGGESGAIPLELAVDGSIVETRDVVVGAGDARAVEFTRTFEEPGDIRVSVSGVNAGTVAVVRRTPTPDTPTPTPDTPTPTPNTSTPTPTPDTPTLTPDTPTRTSVAPADTPASTTPNGADGAMVGPTLGVLSAFVLIGGLAYFVWRRDDDLPDGWGGDGDGGSSGPGVGTAAVRDGDGKAAPDGTAEGEPPEGGSPERSPGGAVPASDGGDAPLLSDEERVLALLREHGGRMKQTTIVDATDWSSAKVSQLLSGMAEDDEIRKLRMGRENLIALPEDVPEGAE